MSVYVSIKHGQKGELLLSSRITGQDQACKRTGGLSSLLPQKKAENRQTSHSEKEQIAETPWCNGLDSRKGLNGIERKLKLKSCFKKLQGNGDQPRNGM